MALAIKVSIKAFLHFIDTKNKTNNFIKVQDAEMALDMEGHLF
jgi:hypothetical protein